MQLGSLTIAWVVARLTVAVASRRLRNTAGLHWVERAARSFAARRWAGLNAVILPFLIGEYVFLVAAPAAGLPAAPTAVLGAFLRR